MYYANWKFRNILFILICILFSTSCSDDFSESESSLSDISSSTTSSKLKLKKGEIPLRPEGSTPIKFKKNRLLDSLKLYTTIDKYITSDGKKVKVILKRRHRPIFAGFSRWKKKQISKYNANKKRKMRSKRNKTEKKKKRKSKGKIRRFFKRNKKKDNGEKSESSSDLHNDINISLNSELNSDNNDISSESRTLLIPKAEMAENYQDNERRSQETSLYSGEKSWLDFFGELSESNAGEEEGEANLVESSIFSSEKVD